ncbi:hypothetical protein HZ993_04810 [Rhodoferax sp. AJA081-3]|uniref:hypothetical protein n=1 Tax=Rhodoferax sp. AJA081-3 TaxID=2752316 RepID=UPI001ADECA82|nr:hypothetical protein [Rhodoferax sp. AJA081-3]QTN29164.1 hypothetical protein HZ993_04810 [Rhodoferax sp. AJA081-3]
MKPANAVLKHLLLRDTGIEVREGSCRIAGAVLPNGSFVVVMDEFWHPLIKRSTMEVLSNGCVVVGCSEYDNVNTSLAFLYREGLQQWQVTHTLDEGDDHLAVEGKPPQLLAGILAQAKKDRREKGYDAVFGVPASLVQQICGFRHRAHPELRFTELVPIPILAHPYIAESLLPHVEPVLLAKGFTKVSSGDDHQSFVAKTDQVDIRCDFVHGGYPNEGGAWVTMRFSVLNHYVQALSTGVPGRGHSLTYKRNFDEIVGGAFSIQTADDLAEWTHKIDSRLPAVIDQMHSIQGLDALANDGSPRRGFFGDPTLSHFDTETGLSRLVLAYLASNPNFERMVAETDAECYGGASPKNPVHEDVAYLKAHAKPVG